MPATTNLNSVSIGINGNNAAIDNEGKHPLLFFGEEREQFGCSQTLYLSAISFGFSASFPCYLMLNPEYPR